MKTSGILYEVLGLTLVSTRRDSVSMVSPFGRRMWTRQIRFSPENEKQQCPKIEDITGKFSWKDLFGGTVVRP